MSDLWRVIAVVASYVALLFLLALWAERKERLGRRVAGNRVVYSLALAVYCTTWTYYGSVGFAAARGVLFLAIYLGPTLAVLLWWWVLRRLVRLKNIHRVTSVADLLSVRYGKSQPLAMLATVLIVIGLVPYISLQLKTMIATTAIVAGRGAGAYPAVGAQVGPPIVLLMILFTIVFGIRRLSPTERHPGMMVALAVECVVKLVAFVAAGAFVTWGLFDGFGDIFRRAADAGTAIVPPLLGPGGGVTTWLSHLLVSAVAILLLPRQFHVAVVENSDEDHIRTAKWLFPAYLVVINLFVLPLALGGLLRGYPATAADSFVLSLPFDAGERTLSWLVFLGGFSAGTGMVVVEAMTLATMVSNHLVVPATAWRPLVRLRRHLLFVRWLAAALVICAAFAYERLFGAHYELVSIGLVSFAAVLQLAPAVLGGLFWRGASTAGAAAGLVGGFAVWAYTLVIPVFVRQGLLPTALLSRGPWDVALLRPETLLGLGGLDPLSHAVFWSLLFNIGGLVVGSLLAPPREEEQAIAARVVDVLAPAASLPEGTSGTALVDAREKRAAAVALLAQYHDEATAERLADACLARVGAREGGRLSALQFAELQAELETSLASAIGTASAHAALKGHSFATPAEALAISRAYGDILAGMKLPPAELQKKIDYHLERERILEREASAQRFLAEVSGRLASSLDLETTARTVVHLPVPQLVDAALLWVSDGQKLPPRVWFAHADPEREQTANDALELEATRLADVGDVAQALASRRPVTGGAGHDSAWPAAVQEATGLAGDVTLPLTTRRGTLGTLSLFLTEGSRLRLPADLTLAEELAHRAAVALENASLYQAAEGAIRARDEFLAVASHELKTPLTPLRITIQTILRAVARGDLAKLPQDRLVELFGGTDGQIRRLVALVDDLLDVSRVSMGRLHLSLETVDLAAAARSVAERHRPELVQSGCDLLFALQAGVIGKWDRLRIEQIVANLIVNAVKYAPGGCVELAVEADSVFARLSVRDHGPGIAPEDQDRIFLPFERAVSYLKASGFGLGLYIVRQVAQAHGGSVRLDSQPGQGCTFTVELPREPPPAA
jgi:Na+/proline symporter/signal transduction histidine kinase